MVVIGHRNPSISADRQTHGQVGPILVPRPLMQDVKIILDQPEAVEKKFLLVY